MLSDSCCSWTVAAPHELQMRFRLFMSLFIHPLNNPCAERKVWHTGDRGLPAIQAGIEHFVNTKWKVESPHSVLQSTPQLNNR